MFSYAVAVHHATHVQHSVFDIVGLHLRYVLPLILAVSLAARIGGCIPKCKPSIDRWTLIGIGGFYGRMLPISARVTSWFFFMGGIIFCLIYFNVLPWLWKYLGVFSSPHDSSDPLNPNLFPYHATAFILLHLLYRFVGLASQPYPKRQQRDAFMNSPEFVDKIGVLIPCHKSCDEIADTLIPILRSGIKPEHIIVADNSNDPMPPDNTRDIVHAIDDSIVYFYINQGLKTRALWESLRMLPDEVEYVLHIDDDTVLDDHMIFDEKLFDDPSTSCVSYGIVMSHEHTMAEALTDFQFKTWNVWRRWRDATSTVWFCHGIIGLWRREIFTSLLEQHPFLPFGEDNWNGTMNMMAGYQMRQENRSHVTTFAPPQFFGCWPEWMSASDREQGYGASNLWKQRAERWLVNAPRRILWRVWLFLAYDCQSFPGNVMYRVEVYLHLIGIVFRMFVPFWWARVVYDRSFLLFVTLKGIYYGGDLLLYSFVNWVVWWNRPDMRSSVGTVLAFPLFRLFLLVCGVYGHWKCVLWYIPFNPFNTSVYTINRESNDESEAAGTVSPNRHTKIQVESAHFISNVYGVSATPSPDKRERARRKIIEDFSQPLLSGEGGDEIY